MPVPTSESMQGQGAYYFGLPSLCVIETRKQDLFRCSTSLGEASDVGVEAVLVGVLAAAEADVGVAGAAAAEEAGVVGGAEAGGQAAAGGRGRPLAAAVPPPVERVRRVRTDTK